MEGAAVLRPLVLTLLLESFSKEYKTKFLSISECLLPKIAPSRDGSPQYLSVLRDPGLPEFMSQQNLILQVGECGS